MNQCICNYRTIGDISTTDSSFLPSVYNFYKNDIIMPKKSQDDMILLLGKEYGLNKVLYSELDRMTADSAISLINYNKPENTRNIHTHDIWQLPQNLATSRFYKDFYERFVKIGDSPKIILVYIPDKDYIMSNSSFFETVCENKIFSQTVSSFLTYSSPAFLAGHPRLCHVRYAIINLSISPSITAVTFPLSAPVL